MYQRTSRGTILLNEGKIRITKKQYKKYLYLTNRANIKRQEVLSHYSQKRLREMQNKKDSDKRGGDFITSKKEYSLKQHHWDNQKSFNRYLKRLEEISTGKYQKKQYSQYKTNLLKSLATKFNSEGEELADKLADLSDTEIRNITLGDKLHDIGWIYREPKDDDYKFTTIEAEIKKIVNKRGAK